MRVGIYTPQTVLRPPGPFAAVGLLGDARRLPGWGWLIPRVSPISVSDPTCTRDTDGYPFAARPRKGDVRKDVIEPRCG